jgi:hypothetical protein
MYNIEYDTSMGQGQSIVGMVQKFPEMNAGILV